MRGFPFSRIELGFCDGLLWRFIWNNFTELLKLREIAVGVAWNQADLPVLD